MKKTFLAGSTLSMILICLFNICSAQSYRYVYYFDEELESTQSDKAVIVGRGLKEEGNFKLDYYFKKTGNLLMTIHYKDSSLKVSEGQLTKYYPNGKISEQGDYLDDKKNGLWQKWDSLGKQTDSTVYDNDRALKIAKFGYHENGRTAYTSFKDSLADTFTSTSFNNTGGLTEEIYFIGQKGLRKKYDSNTVKTDSLFTRVEIEASFPGGQPAWIRYLQKNLDPSVPVRQGAPAGTYQVIVKFIVSKDGKISDVRAETNHGFGMEKEVIRIIKNGPKWVPAIQFGQNVNAYRRQPITFMVEDRRN